VIFLTLPHNDITVKGKERGKVLHLLEVFQLYHRREWYQNHVQSVIMIEVILEYLCRRPVDG